MIDRIQEMTVELYEQFGIEVNFIRVGFRIYSILVDELKGREMGRTVDNPYMTKFIEYRGLTIVGDPSLTDCAIYIEQPRDK
jgi:hypothetical protein